MVQSMILSEASREPWGAMVAMQRWVNRGSPSGYRTTLPPPYDPGGLEPSFDLPYVCIQLSSAFLVKTRPWSPVLDVALDGHGLRLFCHPLMWASYRDLLLEHSVNRRCGSIRVCPTSSPRTVRALSALPAVIKLAYDGVLGRYRRPISVKTVEHVREVSIDFQEVVANADSSALFGCFDEPVAAACTLKGDRQLGISFRETQARPLRHGPHLTIPAHALWSEDALHRDDPSLLAQLVLARSQHPSCSVLVEEVIRPVLVSYLQLATEWGLMPEAHGQNTFLELTRDYRISRVVYQGYGGFLRDLSVRRDRGLRTQSDQDCRKCLAADDLRRFEERSWYFDEKLSLYTVNEIVKRFCKDFSVNITSVTGKVKDLYTEVLAAIPPGYLPDIGYRQKDTGAGSNRVLEMFRPLYRTVD